jgi:galactokinase
MDQMACVFGRADHLLLLDCATLDIELVRFPASLALVVLESGVHRQLEASAYQQRRDELIAAVRRVGRRPADLKTDELHALVVEADLDDVQARRLMHAVAENQRVRAAAGLLRRQPWDSDSAAALGALLTESHGSLRELFEVSTVELDALVAIAIEHGALGARLTGAGFGGSVLALAEADRAGHVLERALESYQRRFEHLAPTGLVARPDDGARTR